MSALIALTRREIQERRPLLWGTLCAALIPILARLQWWLPAGVRREYHEALAVLFGIAFPIALAIGLGASVIGEDLSGRRLGFYFSRPVSGLAIWASKTLGAILVTFLGWSCFLLPALLFMGAPPSPLMADVIRKAPDWLPGWISLLIVLVLVAQAVAGAYRARDGLIAVDIALFASLATAVYFIGSRLSSAAGWHIAPGGVSFNGVDGVPILFNTALAILALAGGLAAAAQVVVGRTDARRGHVALSICLWGTLGVAVIAGALLARWVLSVAPRDVGAADFSIRSTPSASHLAFAAGRDRAGYQPLFLLDVATGEVERIPPRLSFGFPRFSADGRRAVFVENADGVPTLVVHRLEGGKPTPLRSALPAYAGSEPRMTGLSGDGKRAILALKDRIAVVETDSGREVATASQAQLGVHAAMPIWRSRGVFVGDTVVFFFVAPPVAQLPVSIVRFDLRTGQVVAGPSVMGDGWVNAIRDEHALVSGRNGSLERVDGMKTRLLAAPEEGAAVRSATILEDGRAAALMTLSGVTGVRVWDREGRLALDVPAPVGEWILSGEPRPGWLSLAASFNRPRRTVFVDLASGNVARTEEGLLPAVSGIGEDENLPAGSPGSRLFVGTRGEVILLEPETGRREAVLVPPRPEAE